MPKIQEVKGRFSLTLPKQIARLKGWKKGDETFFNIDIKTGKVTLEVLKLFENN
ncbi:hypothetical protein HYY74_04585 [Candidatus Woesearchaeota archaeon]|nr:hypothetical protein [Candidatus Woesearchaeota archaeon]